MPTKVSFKKGFKLSSTLNDNQHTINYLHVFIYLLKTQEKNAFAFQISRFLIGNFPQELQVCFQRFLVLSPTMWSCNKQGSNGLQYYTVCMEFRVSGKAEIIQTVKCPQWNRHYNVTNKEKEKKMFRRFLKDLIIFRKKYLKRDHLTCSER